MGLSYITYFNTSKNPKHLAPASQGYRIIRLPPPLPSLNFISWFPLFYMNAKIFKQNFNLIMQETTIFKSLFSGHKRKDFWSHWCCTGSHNMSDKHISLCTRKQMYFTKVQKSSSKAALCVKSQHIKPFYWSIHSICLGMKLSLSC